MISSRRVRGVRLLSLLTLFAMITSLFAIAPPQSAQATCTACTIWSPSTAPTNGPVASGQGLELGLRFESTQAGFIKGLRFYKQAGNTGPHFANLWSEQGTLLTTARFANETASGWQEVIFERPIAISANVIYVASYHSKQGPYAIDYGYFNQGSLTNGPLKAVVGTYIYSDATTFPNGVYDNSNYWVDPIFSTTNPGTISQSYPNTSLFETATPPGTNNDPNPLELGMKFRTEQAGYITALRYYKYGGNTGIHPGSLWSEDGQQLLARVTFTNETATGWQQARLNQSVAIVPGKTYIVSYHTDTGSPALQIGGMSEPVFDYPLFAPAAGTIGGNGVYKYTAAPAFPDGSYNAANYFVDVVFASTPLPTMVPAQGPATTIWTSIVTPTLSTTTAQAELGVKFQSLRAGYITGIRFFNMQALPLGSERLGNLWSTTGELLASAIFSTGSSVGWYEVTFAKSVPISANVTYVASYHTNNGGYAYSNNYFVSSPYENPPLRALSSSEANGNGVYKNGVSGFPDQTSGHNYWVDVRFADEPAPPPPAVNQETIWSDSLTPVQNLMNDNSVLVHLGVKVRANRDGVIHGMHYVNGDPVARSHTARLWSSTGTLLASKTFTNQPVVGWEYIYFDAPVNVTANTTYVMSYDTMGKYPNTPSGFSNPGPSNSKAIRALADGEDGYNGVYSYDTNFPIQSYYGNNYFVDVIFSAQGQTIEDTTERIMLWNELPTPTVTFYEEQSIEVGLRFRSEQAGAISALRFYNSDPLTKTHIAHLWTNQGILLASQTMVVEANRLGWVEIPFTTPVSITANTTYVASYWTDGPYWLSYTSGYFATAYSNLPLTGLADGQDGANGAYQHGPSTLPTQGAQGANYWVDVVLRPSGVSSASFKGQAADASAPGPYTPAFLDYSLPAKVNTDILQDDLLKEQEMVPNRITQIAGRVYYPQGFKGLSPLVVMLHGNHVTCGSVDHPHTDLGSEYTYTGECPDKYDIESGLIDRGPLPSHHGYDYLAGRLASQGYIVISIDANRGINGPPPGPIHTDAQGYGTDNDPYLIYTRARLVLKHLEYFLKWTTNNATQPADVAIPASLKVLVGKINFTNVGLFGHSRGGEAVRAAYNIYYNKSADPDFFTYKNDWKSSSRAPGISLKAIFEVAPTDFHNTDIGNIPWNVVLPMCDGDVANLAGIRPFDRASAGFRGEKPKSSYMVKGANHNFYNREWDQSDSISCTSQTALSEYNQRKTGLITAVSFFKSTLKGFTIYHRNFDPLYRPPTSMTDITSIQRNFLNTTAQSTLVLDDFTPSYQSVASSTGAVSGNLVKVFTQNQSGHHDQNQAALALKWTSANDENLVTLKWSATKDLTTYSSLDMRLTRVKQGPGTDNPDADTNFTVRLIYPEDTYSLPVNINSTIKLDGPYANTSTITEIGYVEHPILQMVRIPLSDFGYASKEAVVGIQIRFNKTSTGLVDVANIRVTK